MGHSPVIMLILVMGVAGSGKTTVGKDLAKAISFEYLEADEFHSETNKKKMHDGIPLTDEDRQPWLEGMKEAIKPALVGNAKLVLACSALKQKYRDFLLSDGPEYRIVYLYGERELLYHRLTSRKSHFMNPNLIDSQLATLEEPKVSLRIHVGSTPEQILGSIVRYLNF